MKRFDVNCFSGHWPFHSTAHPGCEHLAAAHKAAGIEGGLITSLQTVFYLDPLTAARQLYQQLPEGYGQVFAINPALPDAGQLCIDAFENYAVKGIRLVPTFHNFSWEDKGTQAVLSAAEKLALPLFITLNLEDPRVDYMVLQASLDMAQLSGVLKDLPDVPVIVTHGYWGNLSGLSSAISSRKNTFADISGLNAPLTVLDQAADLLGCEHLMFGSGAHLHALSCSVQNMLHNALTGKQQQMVWYENAANIFGLNGGI